MNPTLIQRTQKFLFATKEEMDEAGLAANVQARLLRLRDIYNYWLNNPQLRDSVIIDELKTRYNIGTTVAYEDLRLIKICLGNLNQCTTDYYRYVFLQRCEEAFEMARKKDDPKAFASALSAFGKYTKLDIPEGNVPDYSQIVPQQFEITADPEAAGFKRIPDLEKKVKKMLARYIQEAETPREADAIEITPIEKTMHKKSSIG